MQSNNMICVAIYFVLRNQKMNHLFHTHYAKTTKFRHGIGQGGVVSMQVYVSSLENVSNAFYVDLINIQLYMLSHILTRENHCTEKDDYQHAGRKNIHVYLVSAKN
jgi:hypothetical protein